ncbi:hypothetical protein [Paracoccus pacificus]|uniref:Meckel syndrome type 1 protein n=1 Tax=Paracoccus pacificus TaxID=1463598 RepID=A0ABW4RAQ3_9RHOB
MLERAAAARAERALRAEPPVTAGKKRRLVALPSVSLPQRGNLTMLAAGILIVAVGISAAMYFGAPEQTANNNGVANADAPDGGTVGGTTGIASGTTEEAAADPTADSAADPTGTTPPVGTSPVDTAGDAGITPATPVPADEPPAPEVVTAEPTQTTPLPRPKPRPEDIAAAYQAAQRVVARSAAAPSVPGNGTPTAASVRQAQQTAPVTRRPDPPLPNGPGVARVGSSVLPDAAGTAAATTPATRTAPENRTVASAAPPVDRPAIWSQGRSAGASTPAAASPSPASPSSASPAPASTNVGTATLPPPSQSEAAARPASGTSAPASQNASSQSIPTQPTTTHPTTALPRDSILLTSQRPRSAPVSARRPAEPAVASGDNLPQQLPARLPQDQIARVDAEGRITPTENGVRTPEGQMLYKGRPPGAPPPRPASISRRTASETAPAVQSAALPAAQSTPAPSTPAPSTSAPSPSAPATATATTTVSTQPAAAQTETAPPTAATPAVQVSVAPRRSAAPPPRPTAGPAEEGSAPEPEDEQPLTRDEQDHIAWLARDLRLAQAGNAGLSEAERALIKQVGNGRPRQRPGSGSGSGSAAAPAATQVSAAPVTTAQDRLARSDRPQARPSGKRAASADSRAVDAAIAAAIAESPAAPGGVALSSLQSSPLPPRAVPEQRAAAPTPQPQPQPTPQPVPRVALAPQPQPQVVVAPPVPVQPAPRVVAPAPTVQRNAPLPQIRMVPNKPSPPPGLSRVPQAQELDNEPEPERVVPKGGPTAAGVARTATQSRGIDLRRTTLIGIFGAGRNSRALVRTGNGRFVKLKLGDRLDGGVINSIGNGQVTYVKGGRQQALRILDGR